MNMRYPLREGRGICWVCGKPLETATTGKNRGQLSFVEMTVDGNPVRAHHACADSHGRRRKLETVTARARTDHAGDPIDDVTHRHLISDEAEG